MPKQIPRSALVHALRASPRLSSTELARTLGVTRQFVVRLLNSIPPHEVLVAGAARRTRYALRRPLRGNLDDLPVYAVGSDGAVSQLTTMSLVAPEGTFAPLAETTWPVPPESRDGWWDGLPYPIYAIRPQGYLGRLLARVEHRELGVAENPEDWSDDDILWVLSRRGTNVPGNLLVGALTHDHWLDAKLDRSPPLREADVARAYVRFAQDALAAAGGGSSAAGEFPKFIAQRKLPGAITPHVIVKFSGAGASAAQRRWADLLVCEHLALETIRRVPSLAGARSRIVSAGGRTFLEVERFDRLGPDGRRSLCALDAIVPSFLGSTSTQWPELMRRLVGLKLVAEADADAVDSLWWFGRLIANTDMHLGNLSFHAEEIFRLAPAYDMLPMAYAPLPGGEVPQRDFQPPLPRPEQQARWHSTAAMAMEFWTMASADARISKGFRRVCAANVKKLSAIAARL